VPGVSIQHAGEERADIIRNFGMVCELKVDVA
jgi:hypothetical protein